MQLELLRPQQIIIEHLRQQKNALVWAGMGISKTAACLHRLTELFLSAEATAALVIAPLRVASLTWPGECQKWSCFHWLKVANLRTEYGQRCFLNGSAHIYLINWDAMKLLVSLVERRKGTIPFDVAVYDESTKAKNPSSKRVNLYRRKVPRAERHWALSGTPMPNSWLDLFAQVRLVDNGERLGTNFLTFKKEFFFAPSTMYQPWKPKADTEKQLEEKISDISITLKSSDWLQIPDVVIEDVEVPFTPALREQYETLEKELVIELRKDKTMNVANSAALITKLLQFTSGYMYDEERVVHAIHELKFDALKQLLKEEKTVMVVTAFQHEEARIRGYFPQAQFFSDCKRSSAEATIAEEKKMIDAWNAGKIQILSGHPASIGHGLNLQYGCNTLVFITLTYNREHYEQVIARLARRGQTEITKVYRLMVPETVDWAVAGALEAKAENEARLISALQMLESFRNGGNGK